MGTKTLFQELDLTINTNDRIGMVGHNGSGKSTLLSILEGSEPPDAGVLMPDPAEIGPKPPKPSLKEAKKLPRPEDSEELSN